MPLISSSRRQQRRYVWHNTIKNKAKICVIVFLIYLLGVQKTTMFVEHDRPKIQKKLGNFTSAPMQSVAHVAKRHELDKLSRLSPRYCPHGRVLIRNIPISTAETNVGSSGPRKIPLIVHQTSRSRCVTRPIFQMIKTWKFPGHAYYFHDDDAVDKLFRKDWNDTFPHLTEIATTCLPHGTAKADLWRYLVLWKYGGIYSDIDNVPMKFTKDTIEDSDEAFFVVEQFHLLSQWFMAVSPGHPLLKYAIERALDNIMKLPTLEETVFYTPDVTGPRALHLGFIDFMKDADVVIEEFGIGIKAVKAGVYVGTGGKTVRVAGVGENQNEYVVNGKMTGKQKKWQYERMNMTHFSDYQSNTTFRTMGCRQLLEKKGIYVPKKKSSFLQHV